MAALAFIVLASAGGVMVATPAYAVPPDPPSLNNPVPETNNVRMWVGGTLPTEGGPYVVEVESSTDDGATFTHDCTTGGPMYPGQWECEPSAEAGSPRLAMGDNVLRARVTDQGLEPAETSEWSAPITIRLRVFTLESPVPGAPAEDDTPVFRGTSENVGVLVTLLPLRGMDGYDVFSVSRWLWLGAYFAVLVVFCLLVLPDLRYWSRLGERLGPWFWIFGVFAVLSLGVYIATRRSRSFREARAEEERAMAEAAEHAS